MLRSSACHTEDAEGYRTPLLRIPHMLSSVCCLPSTVCCLLSAVCCLLSAACCSLFRGSFLARTSGPGAIPRNRNRLRENSERG